MVARYVEVLSRIEGFTNNVETQGKKAYGFGCPRLRIAPDGIVDRFQVSGKECHNNEN